MRFVITALFLVFICAGPSFAASGPLTPEEEAEIQAKADELFPDKPKAPPPEPSALDHGLGAVSSLVYLPTKCVVAVVYTIASGFHLLAFAPEDAGRIAWEGWTGDWLVLGTHFAGGEPLDVIGPDAKFPGHNPIAREAFIRGSRLLVESFPYRGIPKGAEAAPPAAEAPAAP
ncbi:MAG: hypothetical protein AB1405_11445 [Bdellovibrionota bacterium]